MYYCVCIPNFLKFTFVYLSDIFVYFFCICIFPFVYLSNIPTGWIRMTGSFLRQHWMRLLSLFISFKGSMSALRCLDCLALAKWWEWWFNVGEWWWWQWGWGWWCWKLWALRSQTKWVAGCSEPLWYVELSLGSLNQTWYLFQHFLLFFKPFWCAEMFCDGFWRTVHRNSSTSQRQKNHRLW